MGDYGFLIIILGAFALMWFMSSRTRKQQAQAARFRDNLTSGQEVMTGSGLFGTVVAVEGTVVTLEISPGVTSRWLKPAIAKLVEPPVDDAEEEDDEPVEDEDTPQFEVPDDASSLIRDSDEDDDTRR